MFADADFERVADKPHVGGADVPKEIATPSPARAADVNLNQLDATLRLSLGPAKKGELSALDRDPRK